MGEDGYQRSMRPAGSAVRLPAAEEALQPLHARDGQQDLRHAAGQVPEDLRDARRDVGARQDQHHLLRLGWTQHTVGSQNIRTMAMIQLLLGNMGAGRRRERAARPLQRAGA